MKNCLYTICLLAFLVSCKNETPQQKTAVPTVRYPQATFVIDTFMDSLETPFSYVSFANGNTLERIDTVTGHFNLMTAEEKADAKMPASYIVAGTTFWAGLRQTLVIDSTAEGFSIKTRFEDSESDLVESFELVKHFPK